MRGENEKAVDSPAVAVSLNFLNSSCNKIAESLSSTCNLVPSTPCGQTFHSLNLPSTRLVRTVRVGGEGTHIAAAAITPATGAAATGAVEATTAIALCYADSAAAEDDVAPYQPSKSVAPACCRRARPSGILCSPHSPAYSANKETSFVTQPKQPAAAASGRAGTSICHGAARPAVVCGAFRMKAKSQVPFSSLSSLESKGVCAALGARQGSAVAASAFEQQQPWAVSAKATSATKVCLYSQSLSSVGMPTSSFACSTFQSLATTAFGSSTLPPPRITHHSREENTSASSVLPAAALLAAVSKEEATASGADTSEPLPATSMLAAAAAASVSAAVPPPFPSLPVTCGVSPPAETLLLRDLQMLRLQRMLRTASAKAAKSGLQQQQQYHGVRAGQQQRQHPSKAGQQRQGTWDRNVPQQDPAWLKNFSGWVLLQLSPTSAALARALTTIKGNPQQITGDPAAAAALTEEKKRAALRTNTRTRVKRKKGREAGCSGGTRIRAASVATRPAAKAAAAGGRGGTAVKRNIEDVNRKEVGLLQRAQQQQQGAKDQNDRGESEGVTRQRRTGSSSDMACTATVTADHPRLVNGVLPLPEGSVGLPAQRTSSNQVKTKIKNNSRGITSSSGIPSSSGIDHSSSGINSSCGVNSSSGVHSSRSLRSSRSFSSSSSGSSSSSLSSTMAASRRERSENEHDDEAVSGQALSMLEAEVYMSRQTLLQSSGPRLSGFTDCSGKGVRVQRHLIEQILASAAPRFVFEQFHAQGVQAEPSLARYLEKRRIQNTLRRLKEHVEMKLEEATAGSGTATERDFTSSFIELARAAVTRCPSRCSLSQGAEKQMLINVSGRRSSTSTSTAAAQLLPQLQIQQEAVCAALETLDWWAPGMNEQDKKEMFFAVATAGLQQQALQQDDEKQKKPLPHVITQQGWLRAFRVLPFNLPDWPVPSSAFPAPSETLRPLLPFLATPSSSFLGDSNSSSSNSKQGIEGSSHSSRDRKRSSSTSTSVRIGSTDAGAGNTRSGASIDPSASLYSVGWTGAQASHSRGVPSTISTVPHCSRFFVLNRPQYILTVATQRKTDCSCCCMPRGEHAVPRGSCQCHARATAAGVTAAGAVDSAISAGKRTTGVTAAPTEGSLRLAHSRPGKTGDSLHTAASAGEATTTLPRSLEANYIHGVKRDRDIIAAGEDSYSMPQQKQQLGTTRALASSSRGRCSCSSFAVPCLCGVLHLCRVALLICEALCQPVSRRFPHLLCRLSSTTEASSPAGPAGTGCQVSQKEERLQRGSLAETSAARRAHVFSRSSSGEICTATAANFQQQKQHHLPSDDSAGVLLSQGAAMRKQGNSSGASGKVKNEYLVLKSDGSFLEKTEVISLSENQRMLRSEPEEKAADTQVSTDPPSKTPSASAAIGQMTDSLQHLDKIHNPLHPADRSRNFSSSSFPSSTLASSPVSLSSSSAPEKPHINKDKVSFDAALPPLRAVPSPYPPSSLLCLLTHAAAAAQQRRYQPQRCAYAAASENTVQTRREMKETQDNEATKNSTPMHQPLRAHPAQLPFPCPGDTQHQMVVVEQPFSQEIQQALQQQEDTSASAPAQLMIPAWHVEQDFLLSRLVSLEEVQGALGLLLPAAWVLAGLQLIIGTATTVLSPLEWISLLHPCSSVASSLDVNNIIHRFNTQHPLRLCSVCCHFPGLSGVTPAGPSASSSALSSSHFSCVSSSTSGFPPSSSQAGQQSHPAEAQRLVPTVASLVSRWQRQVEQMCTCYTEKKAFHKLGCEHEPEIHTERSRFVTHDYMAPSASIKGSNQSGETEKTSASSDHVKPITYTAAGSRTATTKKEAFYQEYVKHSSKLNTKQETRKRSCAVTSGDCCNSEDVSEVRSRSGETCSVTSNTSQEKAWACRRDSRSRLGLHWWSFLSLEDKNKRRLDTYEHRHMKKRETTASRGHSPKESRPRSAASSAAKTRSRTCSRRADTANNADSQKCPLRSHSLSRRSETHCTVYDGDSLSEFPNVLHSRHDLESNTQRSGPCAFCGGCSIQARTEGTHTQSVTAESSGSVSAHDHGSCAEAKLATQASACVQLVVESLFASDKARKAFEKLSAAALSSSVIELGMPAGGVDALIPLVRTGGSCCFDLYALLACCKLFFCVFEDAHVLQVLHDLI